MNQILVHSLVLGGRSYHLQRLAGFSFPSPSVREKLALLLPAAQQHAATVLGAQAIEKAVLALPPHIRRLEDNIVCVCVCVSCISARSHMESRGKRGGEQGDHQPTWYSRPKVPLQRCSSGWALAGVGTAARGAMAAPMLDRDHGSWCGLAVRAAAARLACTPRMLGRPTAAAATAVGLAAAMQWLLLNTGCADAPCNCQDPVRATGRSGAAPESERAGCCDTSSSCGRVHSLCAARRQAAAVLAIICALVFAEDGVCVTLQGAIEAQRSMRCQQQKQQLFPSAPPAAPWTQSEVELCGARSFPARPL